MGNTSSSNSITNNSTSSNNGNDNKTFTGIVNNKNNTNLMNTSRTTSTANNNDGKRNHNRDNNGDDIKVKTNNNNSNGRQQQQQQQQQQEQQLDDDEDNNDNVEVIRIEKLQDEINILKTKCQCLEAQNILVSVQQLDLIARCTAILLSCITYYYIYYRFIVCYCIPQITTSLSRNVLLPYLWEQWNNSTNIIKQQQQEKQPMLLVQVAVIFFQSSSDWFVAAATSLPTTIQYIVEVMYTILYQCIFLMIIPYVHYKKTHGLIHRRYEIFSIFFIVFIRIKLCQWREKTFAVDTTDNDNDNNNNNVEDDETNIQRSKIISNSNNNISSSSYGVGITEESIWDANYEISARFLYISIRRLKGLWIKVAQYLSSRADFVPPSYVRELQKLQDEAPISSWDEIQNTIPSNIYNNLCNIQTDKPLASASIAQVHTAQIRRRDDCDKKSNTTTANSNNNELVVIKVQHPFARTLILSDLIMLKIICRIVSILEPDYGFLEILMNEWSIETKKELNFLLEANNLVEANNNIQQMIYDCNTNIANINNDKNEVGLMYTNPTKNCLKSIPFQVEIPRPYLELCTKDVLVMSYCDGTRIDDINSIVNEWNIPCEAVLDAITQTFAHMMYVGTIFNGDPHTGNLKIRKGTTYSKEDGFTIILLDWGLVKKMTSNKRLAFCQMAYACATYDFGLLFDSFTTIGLKLKRENNVQDMINIRFLFRNMVPAQQSRQIIKAKIQRDKEIRKTEKKFPIDSKAYPGEFFFFIRVNELLHGLGSKLHVELAYLDVIKPFAERGLLRFPFYNGEYDNNIKSFIPTSMSQSSDKLLERKVSDMIEKLQNENQIAGVQVAVLDANGNHLVHVVSGHLGGLKRNIEMRPDALVLGFSCTKAVTATMAHIMVKEGYLSYDEPICERVWPAFCPTELPPVNLFPTLKLSGDDINKRWAWKRQVTLRHILSHTSGFWSALPSSMTMKKFTSCEQCAEAFEYNVNKPEETLLPTSYPGTAPAYHFMSFGWLVAGVLIGAYSVKHQKKEVTFYEVYTSILVPKLSKETLQNGFCPCGILGKEDEEFPLAHLDTKIVSADDMALKKKEAEEKLNSNSMQSEGNVVAGRELLLDSRIWNCKEAMKATVPAAGGRFSASGLAKFYHDLGTVRILDRKTLDTATEVASNFFSDGLIGGRTADITSLSLNSAMGLGYQLLKFREEPKPSAFGHSGVGGSIGFHHKDSGISVAVLLNKPGADKETGPRIVRTISDHFDW